MKLLTRPGELIKEMGQTCLADPDAAGDAARTLRPLQAALSLTASPPGLGRVEGADS